MGVRVVLDGRRGVNWAGALLDIELSSVVALLRSHRLAIACKTAGVTGALRGVTSRHACASLNSEHPHRSYDKSHGFAAPTGSAMTRQRTLAIVDGNPKP